MLAKLCIGARRRELPPGHPPRPTIGARVPSRCSKYRGRTVAPDRLACFTRSWEWAPGAQAWCNRVEGHDGRQGRLGVRRRSPARRGRGGVGLRVDSIRSIMSSPLHAEPEGSKDRGHGQRPRCHSACPGPGTPRRSFPSNSVLLRTRHFSPMRFAARVCGKPCPPVAIDAQRHKVRRPRRPTIRCTASAGPGRSQVRREVRLVEGRLRVVACWNPSVEVFDRLSGSVKLRPWARAHHRLAGRPWPGVRPRAVGGGRTPRRVPRRTP